ncbi:peptidase S58 DmpA [Kribbella flavida DSM 17836]|uniref:Peptidase S58 DmpA n=1 Tax=Kribbella flavida (strain DSM 17836 / JCM 10339 / NBRC 14399) TaxID=479435 RepID=D2PLU7_KRIFD|nr:P1 family peptidase [Kribbella flavida]ADB32527.1 peptidase S58 DmpA [Kribbella flavida DSM 17836]
MQPGPQNAITDVPGVLVGQVERVEPPYLTGVTVLHFPGTAVAGVDVRGGAPGTRETDLLDPVNSNANVNAIVLTGGSAYGLDAATGVMAWLEQRGEGVRVGPGERDVVPIVPAAVIFDLGRGGEFGARPTHEWGRAAVASASGGPVATGNRGAGAGARAGRLKGGVGSASVGLGDGTTVGALVVLNAVGSAVAPNGRLYGEDRLLDGEVPPLETPTEAAPEPPEGARPGMNTVIAVVATDAPLDKAAARRLAMVAHDGLARGVDPVHTLLDGDSVFGVSTAPHGVTRLSVTDPAALGQLESVFSAGARCLTRAIVHAVLAAETVRTPGGRLLSYRDAYPSAFSNG